MPDTCLLNGMSDDDRQECQSYLMTYLRNIYSHQNHWTDTLSGVNTLVGRLTSAFCNRTYKPLAMTCYVIINFLFTLVNFLLQIFSNCSMNGVKIKDCFVIYRRVRFAFNITFLIYGSASCYYTLETEEETAIEFTDLIEITVDEENEAGEFGWTIFLNIPETKLEKLFEFEENSSTFNLISSLISVLRRSDNA